MGFALGIYRGGSAHFFLGDVLKAIQDMKAGGGFVLLGGV